MKTEYICQNCGYRGFPVIKRIDTYNHLSFYFGTLTKATSGVDLRIKICPNCKKRAMKSTYVNPRKPMNPRLRILVVILCLSFLLFAAVIGILYGNK
jgi:hypothetical protein